jgi:hypothetical protein
VACSDYDSSRWHINNGTTSCSRIGLFDPGKMELGGKSAGQEHVCCSISIRGHLQPSVAFGKAEIREHGVSLLLEE